MQNAIALAALLVVAGCHGTDLRLGTGRDSGALRASGSSGHGKHAADWSVSDRGGRSYWAEVGFQLTPKTVRNINYIQPIERPVLARLHVAQKPTHPTPAPDPFTPDPGFQPTDPIDEITARLDAIDERLDAALGPLELLLGGGGGAVALLLSFMGVREVRRRRASKVDEGVGV